MARSRARRADPDRPRHLLHPASFVGQAHLCGAWRLRHRDSRHRDTGRLTLRRRRGAQDPNRRHQDRAMLIGVPKEIKDNEYRVGLVPSAVRELAAGSHRVLVETGAGLGAGLADSDYEAAGGEIVPGADDVFARAELIVKVKEPLAVERKKLRRGQVLFTYLHLAPDVEQTRDLLASGATCIAYETVTSASGGLPLLTPMSEVAGRLAPQVGASCLEKAQGGRGILLGGVPGVPPAEVVVLGGGVSGTHAATIALGMGANVTVVDRSADVLRRLSVQFGSQV